MDKIVLFSNFDNSVKTQKFYVDQENKKLEIQGYYLNALINYKGRVRDIDIAKITPKHKSKEYFVKYIWNDFLEKFEKEYEVKDVL